MRKGYVVLAVAFAVIAIGCGAGSSWARDYRDVGQNADGSVYYVEPGWNRPLGSGLRATEIIFGAFAVVTLVAAVLPARRLPI